MTADHDPQPDLDELYRRHGAAFRQWLRAQMSPSLREHEATEDLLQSVFRDVVAAHPNVWGVHCGHVDGEFRQISRNVAGLPVHEVLIDYQNMADGGGGWLRLLRFKPSEDEVEAITFSTLTGEVRADGDGFEHAIMILGDYKDRAADALEEFGLTEEDLDELLRQVQMEGIG